MSRIAEKDIDALADIDRSFVFVRNKELYRADSVVHSVERLVVVLAAALSLTAAPLGFKFLNVSTVAEHNAAKVSSCNSRVYLAAEASGVEQREQSRVVDMGVCEQHEVDISGSYRYLDVFKNVLALLHTEIHEEFLAAGFYICTASCDFMGRADEHHFHKYLPPVVSLYNYTIL